MFIDAVQTAGFFVVGKGQLRMTCMEVLGRVQDSAQLGYGNLILNGSSKAASFN